MKKQGYTEIKSENSSVMNDNSDNTSNLALIKKDKGLGLLQSQEFDLEGRSRKISKEDMESEKDQIGDEDLKKEMKKAKGSKLDQDELNRVFKDKEVNSERSQNSDRINTNTYTKHEIKTQQEVEMKTIKNETSKTLSIDSSNNFNNNNQNNNSMNPITREKSGEKENNIKTINNVNKLSSNNKHQSENLSNLTSKNNSIQKNLEKEEKEKSHQLASASNLLSRSSSSDRSSDSDSDSKDSDSKNNQDNNNSNFNKSYMSKSGFGNDDPVIQGLNIRVREKQKTTKRRLSCLLRKKSQSEKGKVNNEISPASVAALIQKVEKNTPYGRNKMFIKYIDCLIALTVCVNIALSIIDNEVYLAYSDTFFQNYTANMNITNFNITVMEFISKREITPEENSLRMINVCVVIANVVFITLHYIFKIRLLRADKKLSEYDNIFTSGYYKYLFIEVLICAIFYPPYWNSVLSFELLDYLYSYNMNSLVSFFVMLKCYIILRVYSYFSRWTSEAANSVCIKYKVRAGIHFAVKAELKKRPYTMLTIMMMVTLGFCGFALRTFEYGVRDPNSTDMKLKGENNLQDLSNCFWVIIITMTTVGYGEYAPKSQFGRLVGIFACIIGMLLVSLMVVSLAVIAEFTSEEKKAYSIIKKLQADDNAYNKAADVIKNIVKLRCLMVRGTEAVKLLFNSTEKKKKVSNLTARFIIITRLKTSISIFKNDFKIANSYSLPIDEMLKRLEMKLKEDITSLTQNINKVSLVDEHLDSLSYIQDHVQQKMSIILERQQKVADYIVKLNNQNYKTNIKKMLARKANQVVKQNSLRIEKTDQLMDKFRSNPKNMIRTRTLVGFNNNRNLEESKKNHIKDREYYENLAKADYQKKLGEKTDESEEEESEADSSQDDSSVDVIKNKKIVGNRKSSSRQSSSSNSESNSADKSSDDSIKEASFAITPKNADFTTMDLDNEKSNGKIFDKSNTKVTFSGVLRDSRIATEKNTNANKTLKFNLDNIYFDDHDS